LCIPLRRALFVLEPSFWQFCSTVESVPRSGTGQTKQDLARRFDPILLARDCGLELDPWQAELLRERPRRSQEEVGVVVIPSSSGRERKLR
jgi:hypothetical protein